MKKQMFNQENLKKLGIALLLAASAVPFHLATRSTEIFADVQDPERLAGKLYQRITGVPLPLGSSVRAEMVSRIQSRDVLGAAMRATQTDDFVNVALRQFAEPMSNRFNGPSDLNETVATIVGTVKDNRPFTDLLQGNYIYNFGNRADISAWSTMNDQHYRDAQALGLPLTSLVAKNEPRPEVEDFVALLGSREWAREGFLDGTNRRAANNLLNHLACYDIAEIQNTSLNDERVRRDVDRMPGGDPQAYANSCVGCHSMLDPLSQAFAYWDWSVGYQANARVAPPEVAVHQSRSAVLYDPATQQVSYRAFPGDLAWDRPSEVARVFRNILAFRNGRLYANFEYYAENGTHLGAKFGVSSDLGQTWESPELGSLGPNEQLGTGVLAGNRILVDIWRPYVYFGNQLLVSYGHKIIDLTTSSYAGESRLNVSEFETYASLEGLPQGRSIEPLGHSYIKTADGRIFSFYLETDTSHTTSYGIVVYKNEYRNWSPTHRRMTVNPVAVSSVRSAASGALVFAFVEGNTIILLVRDAAGDPALFTSDNEGASFRQVTFRGDWAVFRGFSGSANLLNGFYSGQSSASIHSGHLIITQPGKVLIAPLPLSEDQYYLVASRSGLPGYADCPAGQTREIGQNGVSALNFIGAGAAFITNDGNLIAVGKANARDFTMIDAQQRIYKSRLPFRSWTRQMMGIDCRSIVQDSVRLFDEVRLNGADGIPASGAASRFRYHAVWSGSELYAYQDLDIAPVSKMNKNSDVYRNGFEVPDDSWSLENLNANTRNGRSVFGFSGLGAGLEGRGVRALADAFWQSRAFRECMPKRAFQLVCGRKASLSEEAQIQEWGEQFHASGYDLKSVFARVATYNGCVGQND